MSKTVLELLDDLKSVEAGLRELLVPRGSGLSMSASASAEASAALRSPVTGMVERDSRAIGGSWFVSLDYAQKYNGIYHTGIDLNMDGYRDSGKPVYAIADGEVVFSGTVNGWQGQVLVVRHEPEDGDRFWARYAHIERAVPVGPVRAGSVLGYIADYDRNGPRNDHLHFDTARIDLGARPGDWPGVDLPRLLSDYYDPCKLLAYHSR